MSKINKGGPAFPCELRNSGDEPARGFYGAPDVPPNMTAQYSGLSLRDYFAAKAMQGWTANPLPNDTSIQEVAAWAYRQADAMLKARGAQ